jgi:hypothetical protein
VRFIDIVLEKVSKNKRIGFSVHGLTGKPERGAMKLTVAIV